MQSICVVDVIERANGAIIVEEKDRWLREILRAVLRKLKIRYRSDGGFFILSEEELPRASHFYSYFCEMFLAIIEEAPRDAMEYLLEDVITQVRRGAYVG